MASDIDSKISCRAIALEQVKRALLEQLGTYLISETEVKNYQITKDQITTLAAGIVSAEVIDEKWDGRTYYLKAKILTDPKEVAKSVEILRNDRHKSKELEASKKIAEEAMAEVSRLKKDLDAIKSDTQKQDVYNSAIKKLSATDWFDKGSALIDNGDHQNAIKAYGEAIGLNPQYVDAYNNRGIAYGILGDTQKAINDFNTAIELNPQNEAAYFNRGFAYHILGNNQQAVNDSNMAIMLNPTNAKAYFNRGISYGILGNTEKAINDFNEAVKLNPKYTEAYCNRGIAYGIHGNTQKAIDNFNMAISLNPQYAEAYYNRGLAYDKSGNFTQARKDFNRAGQLNPEYANHSR